MPPCVLRLWIIASVGIVRQAVVSRLFGKGWCDISATALRRDDANAIGLGHPRESGATLCIDTYRKTISRVKVATSTSAGHQPESKRKHEFSRAASEGLS
jgi:hypothetical protein